MSFDVESKYFFRVFPMWEHVIIFLFLFWLCPFFHLWCGSILWMIIHDEWCFRTCLVRTHYHMLEWHFTSLKLNAFRGRMRLIITRSKLTHNERPNVPSLEEKKIGGLFCLESKVIKIGNQNQPNFLNGKRTNTRTDPP